jgi:type II secretory pathway component GspD/PulD (secretin)
MLLYVLYPKLFGSMAQSKPAFRRLFEVTMCASIFSLLGHGDLFAEEELIANPITANPIALKIEDAVFSKSDKYTVNFNNIAITEYIRFVSKIMNANFVFDETDLQFNVTIVSEEPVSIKNIVSALVQVLRIHNLTLLQQENSFLISRSPTVTQIPKVISTDSETRSETAPMVTRVFRIKNGNPSSLAGIIRPMISEGALVEVSVETRQIIVTDITTNVEKVGTLLSALDIPNNSLEVDSYTAKYVVPEELIALATQLVAPFAEGNPLTFVAQPNSNSIFIVSTHYLIEKAISTFEDLDRPQKKTLTTAQEVFFLYKLENLPGDIVQDNLKDVSKELTRTGIDDPQLLQSLQNVKWVKDTNSILITGTQKSVDQIKTLVAQFDVPSKAFTSQTSQFFIYKPLHRPAEDLESAIQSLAGDLKDEGLLDPQLLHTLESVHYAPATGTLLFTGNTETIAKVKELITQVDVPTASDSSIQRIGTLTFFIYKVRNITPAQLMSSLRAITTDFQKSHTADKEFVKTIKSMKMIKETNSVLFTGPQETLEKIQALIENFDVPGFSSTILEKEEKGVSYVLYKPAYQNGDELIAILKDFEQNLIASGVCDKDLFTAINNLKWIPKTNTLLISGDPVSIGKVQDLLAKFDVRSKEDIQNGEISAIENTNFLIYKLQYHKGEEIRDALRGIATDLGKTTAVANTDLLNTINSLQWIKLTNSLLITGNQDTLVRVKELIQNLDIPLRQVFIEVLVIETSLTNTQNFGLQWGGKLNYLNRTAASTGSFPLDPTTGTTTSGGPAIGTFPTALSNVNVATPPNPANIPFLTGFDFGVIGDIIMHKGKSFLSLGSLVNALQTDTDSSIVLNPKIITQDNNNSSIFVGQNIPYIGSLITSTTTTQTSQSSIEYRDIGVSLSITPVIGNGDIVTLDIVHDISEVSNNVNLTSTQQNNITITGIQTSHTNMTTRAHVPDKHFLVLSGMIQDTKTHFKSQIPCLGGLPVIGMAFQENDRLNSKANIIIFVRPHIINSFDQYRQLTETQENIFKDQAVLPVLKEEFDAGLDIIKTPEDE